MISVIRSKTVRSGLVAAVIAAGAMSWSAIAFAQGRIVAIGDSLSDNGNLFAITGSPPPPYFNGRFSNGPTWVELLAGAPMNQPFLTGNVSGNVNLAFGGSRTDNAPNLNGPIPSLPTQIATFMALGGQISARDTVTLWGGANNIFQYFTANPVPTPAGIVATSTGAATDIVAMTNQLIGVGARRLLVANYADIGTTPAFNGSPLTAGAAGLATSVFNATLLQGLQTTAAANRSTNVILMDTNALFRAIAGNPAAFGFTNITQACTAVIACVTGSAAVQNRFAFWDTVHPTEAAHMLIAQYALALLNPTDGAARIGALAEAGTRARMSATDDTFDRMSGWARGAYNRNNGIYASVIGNVGNVQAHGTTPDFRFNTTGMRIGVDKAMGNVLVGGAAGISGGGIGGAIKSDIVVFDADAYVAVSNGPFYIAGQAGGSLVSYEGISRPTGVGPITADGSTRGSQLGAGVEAGVFARFGGFMVVPAARLQYIHSALSGFNETGSILLTAFGDRDQNVLLGGARVRLISDVSTSWMRGSVFGEVGYEHVLAQSGGVITGSFIGNTALPFETGAGNLASRGLQLKAGLDTKLTETAHLTLQYGVALQDGKGEVHTGQARVKVPF